MNDDLNWDYSPIYSKPLTWIPIWIKLTWVFTRVNRAYGDRNIRGIATVKHTQHIIPSYTAVPVCTPARKPGVWLLCLQNSSMVLVFGMKQELHCESFTWTKFSIPLTQHTFNPAWYHKYLSSFPVWLLTRTSPPTSFQSRHLYSTRLLWKRLKIVRFCLAFPNL